MAGVMNDVPDGETWVGIPAMNERHEFQLLAHLRKLPETRRQLRKLEQRVKELGSSSAETRKDAA